MRTGEIAQILNGVLSGNANIEIHSAAAINTAVNGQITFYEHKDEIPATNASCLIVKAGAEFPSRQSTGGDEFSVIAVDHPKLAFASIIAVLHPNKKRAGISENASIDKTAKVNARYIGDFVSVGSGSSIAENTEIHDGTKIGSNVSIGKNSVLFPNCVVYDGSVIGDNCMIHSGVVIGADGFGHVRTESGHYVKFPQIGSVVIENDVEIGANTCIDRGALGETRIGEGTKIDNLVQVGHNVSIGKRCVIAAQTGISGSVVIEDDCIIGGQVGFGDHVRVQSGAIIGSQAGVLPGKIVRPGVW